MGRLGPPGNQSSHWRGGSAFPGQKHTERGGADGTSCQGGAQGPAGRWEGRSLPTLTHFPFYTPETGPSFHLFPFPPKQTECSRSHAGDAHGHLFPAELGPTPHTPRYPEARNHQSGSVFHTLSQYSYRESPETSTASPAHEQSAGGSCQAGRWTPSGLERSHRLAGPVR